MLNITSIRDNRVILQHIMISHPFQTDYVEINSGKWTKEVSMQARDITQCGVRTLYLTNNSRATIMTEIAHIHFTHLTCIRVVGNSIQSIEELARVQMPHISWVSLGSNNITSVGVIRKAAWPSLQILSLSENYFGDGKNLVQGCFAQMEELCVYSAWEEDKNQWTEQWFPAKMAAASLLRLSIREGRFCFSRGREKVLEQRWPGIFIQ